jgi:hypothetical protein
MNPIDEQANAEMDEIVASVVNSVDAEDVYFEALKSACFKIAVLKQKLKIEQDLNREDRVNWKGKA